MLLIIVLLNLVLVILNIVLYFSDEKRNQGSFFSGCGAGIAFLGVVYSIAKLFN